MFEGVLLACRRVAKATGATVIVSLADMDGNETFEASSLGSAEEVRLLSESVSDHTLHAEQGSFQHCTAH